MNLTKNLISKCKRDLLEIYKHALESVKPETLIQSSVEFRNNHLIIKSDGIDPIEYDIQATNIHVIGGGKCVFGMASALGDLVKQANLQHKFSFGSISIPISLKYHIDARKQSNLEAIGVKCWFGSQNNLPDENSVRATRDILVNVFHASKHDQNEGRRSLFLVLISGGGSACLTDPKHLTLDEKLCLISELVQKGANIVELNAVRQCYSNVKGGNLAKRILECNPNSKIVTLILSDIVDDPVEFISSGPTYISDKCDTNLHEQAMRRILQKYDIKIPVIDSIGVEPKTNELAKGAVTNRIIGNNLIAVKHAAQKAQRLGYQVKMLDGPIVGLTCEAMQRLLLTGREYNLRPRDKVLFLAGGETTVKRMDNETWGIGGRVQEFCLDYMISRISNELGALDHIDMLLAASTDGQDGPTDVAGCIASLAEYELLLKTETDTVKFNIDDCKAAKRSHNAYDFWSKYMPEWLVKTGPTGTNVADIYMLSIVDNFHK